MVKNLGGSKYQTENPFNSKYGSTSSIINGSGSRGLNSSRKRRSNKTSRNGDISLKEDQSQEVQVEPLSEEMRNRFIAQSESSRKELNSKLPGKKDLKGRKKKGSLKKGNNSASNLSEDNNQSSNVDGMKQNEKNKVEGAKLSLREKAAIKLTGKGSKAKFLVPLGMDKLSLTKKNKANKSYMGNTTNFTKNQENKRNSNLKTPLIPLIEVMDARGSKRQASLTGLKKRSRPISKKTQKYKTADSRTISSKQNMTGSSDVKIDNNEIKKDNSSQGVDSNINNTNNSNNTSKMFDDDGLIIEKDNQNNNTKREKINERKRIKPLKNMSNSSNNKLKSGTSEVGDKNRDVSNRRTNKQNSRKLKLMAQNNVNNIQKSISSSNNHNFNKEMSSSVSSLRGSKLNTSKRSNTKKNRMSSSQIQKMSKIIEIPKKLNDLSNPLDGSINQKDQQSLNKQNKNDSKTSKDFGGNLNKAKNSLKKNRFNSSFSHINKNKNGTINNLKPKDSKNINNRSQRIKNRTNSENKKRSDISNNQSNLDNETMDNDNSKNGIESSNKVKKSRNLSHNFHPQRSEGTLFQSKGGAMKLKPSSSSNYQKSKPSPMSLGKSNPQNFGQLSSNPSYQSKIFDRGFRSKHLKSGSSDNRQRNRGIRKIKQNSNISANILAVTREISDINNSTVQANQPIPKLYPPSNKLQWGSSIRQRSKISQKGRSNILKKQGRAIDMAERDSKSRASRNKGSENKNGSLGMSMNSPSINKNKLNTSSSQDILPINRNKEKKLEDKKWKINEFSAPSNLQLGGKMFKTQETPPTRKIDTKKSSVNFNDLIKQREKLKKQLNSTSFQQIPPKTNFKAIFEKRSQEPCFKKDLDSKMNIIPLHSSIPRPSIHRPRQKQNDYPFANTSVNIDLLRGKDIKSQQFGYSNSDRKRKNLFRNPVENLKKTLEEHALKLKLNKLKNDKINQQEFQSTFEPKYHREFIRERLENRNLSVGDYSNFDMNRSVNSVAFSKDGGRHPFGDMITYNDYSNFLIYAKAQANNMSNKLNFDFSKLSKGGIGAHGDWERRHFPDKDQTIWNHHVFE